MKISKDTKTDAGNSKIMVLKSKNNGKRVKIPQNRSQPLKIQSCQIKFKVGIDTKTDTRNSKIMIPKPENNGNHTKHPTPNLFNLDLASNEHAQIIF